MKSHIILYIYIYIYIPLEESLTTTSEISNTFNGSGKFLFAATVLRRPGRRVVRATFVRIKYNYMLAKFNLTSLLEIPLFWGY